MLSDQFGQQPGWAFQVKTTSGVLDGNTGHKHFFTS